MSRRPRGGVRAGNPGQAYSNRTDLNANRSLPVTAAPGQTYGARVQQQNAQRLVPMAPPPAMGAPGAGAASGAAAPSPGAGGSFLAPGMLPPLDRPSERPNEPVTAGAALGAGPGNEVLPGGNMMTGGAMSQLLSKAAVASGSSSLRALSIQAAEQGK